MTIEPHVLLILGDPDSGRTSLLNRYEKDTFDNKPHESPVVIDYVAKSDSQKVCVKLRDFGETKEEITD